MADVNHFLRGIEEQLHPDVQDIKYLLKDTLSSKYDNYVILTSFFFKKKNGLSRFLTLLFERYASLE